MPVLAIADRIGIEDLLTALCRAVDDRDPDRLGELVVPDVHFDMGHAVLEGRQVVIDAFRARAQDLSFTARHTWSNLTVEAVGDDHATVTSIFATFAHLRNGDAITPVWRAGDTRDRMVRESDGRWLLAAREMRAVLP